MDEWSPLNLLLFFILLSKMNHCKVCKGCKKNKYFNVLQLKEVAGFPENVSAEKYFPFTTNFSLEHNAANFF
jgi:hypothetical protein